jgi:LysR family hydrogen peroxide-inducible transcriptional activator
MVTLRQLRYLDALARHRHFGRAAEDCSVSQPALSMQIRDLERFLGVELVERRSGDVTLTETGADIARRGKQILGAVNDLADFARHRGQVLSGPLRLGVIPTVAPYLLPRILPRLQKQYPDLRLELRETQTKALLGELERGSLDAIMVALPVAGDADIETMPLFEDSFLLAVPAGEKLAQPEKITPESIDMRRLILLEEGHCLRDQALAFCSVSGRDTMEFGATSLTTVMQMVANDYGVTLLPEIAADSEARDGRVKLLPFSGRKPSRTIGLAWRRTSSRAQDFKALGEVVMETVK